ncbi:MAG: hypothetical protein R3F18_16330 [Lysobacterales bacterium]
MRFGASSATLTRSQYGGVQLPYGLRGRFCCGENNGRYRVDFDKMAAAVNNLSAKILTLQGDGD